MEKLRWETRKVKVKELKPLPDNPRKITKQKKQELSESLDEFDLVEIPVVNTDYTLIAGNQRVLSLIAAGREEEEIDVRYPNRALSDLELKRYAIISNTHAGENDFEILEAKFADTNFRDLGFTIIGLDEWDKKKNKTQLSKSRREYFEIPEEIKTDIEPGDIIEIGKHRLLCADSTKNKDVERLMDGEKAEILLSSVPQNQYDSLCIPAFQPFTNYQVLNFAIRRKDNEIVLYWDEFIHKARQCGLKLLSWNVWDKTAADGIAATTAMFLQVHEFIFVFGSQVKELNKTVPDLKTVATDKFHQLHSVIQKTPEHGNEKKNRPAMLPVGLPFEYIKAMTNEGDIVADAFARYGSTMAAAHQLQRRCFSMEVNPQHCQIIVNRMLKMDSSLEVKINGSVYIK